MVDSLTLVSSSTVAQELLYTEDYKNVCLVQACLLFPAAPLCVIQVFHTLSHSCVIKNGFVCVCV